VRDESPYVLTARRRVSSRCARPWAGKSQKQLSDLDAVEGGAFAELVAATGQFGTTVVGHAGVAAGAAEEALVDPAGAERR
jgi:hypothetical protein